MKHLGDITKISGYEAPTVDIITGGSPCQDLSVAGKRAGLAGDRSGLFMKQIRIIKEMRDKSARMGADNVRPRYMVWENVPGAFSCNKGEDFRAVLEETARIADKAAVVPRPEGGRWSTSGCILADGWSIAWRVHDAQFWGVPQRRKRIALVADFNGETAPEILFERESVRGDIAACGEPREAVTSVTQSSVRASGGNDPVAFHLTQTPVNGDVAPCLSSGNPNSGQCMCGVFQPTYCIQGNCIDRAGTHDAAVHIAVDNHPQDSRVSFSKDNMVQTLSARMGMGGGNTPMIYSIDRAAYNQGANAKYNMGIDENGPAFTVVAKGPGAVCISGDDVAGTLDASYYKGCGSRGGIEREVVSDYGTVRWLTPLECERLQGFPDGWTDIGDWTDSKGKLHRSEQNDSARYKALGNSIALPFWQWLAERICKQYGQQPTMASLFDGIGGFPLVFSRAGAKPEWCSEIEEFPIAVTKVRFTER